MVEGVGVGEGGVGGEGVGEGGVGEGGVGGEGVGEGGVGEGGVGVSVEVGVLNSGDGGSCVGW